MKGKTMGSSEESMWRDRMVYDNSRGEFSLKLHTQMLQRKDPPMLGPDDDHLKWCEIAVWLTLGGRPLSEPVRFPAHEPLDAAIAFAAAMKAALADPPVA
jgi:hypothetical protein